VRATTIGFEAVKALLAGRVDAATAFWNAEGVALERRRPGFTEFRVDDFGAPPYPELVLCVTRTTLEDRGPLVRAVVRALQRGYAQAQVEPDSAIAALQSQARAGDRAELAAQLDAVAPAFTAGARAPGELRKPVLERWARWDRRFGILKTDLDVDKAFDFDQVVPVRNP
jgi:ABC-type nitrate/sulfonate/bicarbonate transport system substrate-binding protein